VKTLKEKYIELCLKLDDADNATDTKKYNQAMRALIKLDKYFEENREEAVFLVDLLTHENNSVRGHTAVRCYDWGINSKQSLAVMEEIYKNAPIGNLRANMGFKVEMIHGRWIPPHLR